jgi:hypothetical protein
MKPIKESWQRFVQKLRTFTWLNVRSVLFLVVAVLFLFLLFWGEPITHFLSDTENQSVQTVLTPSSISGTHIVIPPEVISINNQINLDVIGAIILFLVIVTGTLTTILSKRNLPVKDGRNNMKQGGGKNE